METGRLIRQLREARGMSLEELADRLDVPSDCLQDIEEGRRKLASDGLKEVSEIFGVPLSSLEEGPPSDGEPDDKTVAISIGRLLRELREGKGFTLAELGKQAGISLAHISEIERGRSAASLKTLEKLTAVLGISVSQLLRPHEGFSLGEKIRRLRRKFGMTQKDLAKRVDLSHGLIGQIETGKVQPAISTLTRIAEVLGVSSCYLLMEENNTAELINSLGPEVHRSLAIPNLRDLLFELSGLEEIEIGLVIGFARLLREWRNKSTGHFSPDPKLNEIMETLKWCPEEDKDFILDSVRFIQKKRGHEGLPVG
ncbi:MAG: helix-turn-helix domain-containing protein [Firmicutes bacterium]|nr:helix-turn-helix domain-containing protein [Bacillota bacterium]MCL5040385.1 helix-turn-helix domain-containing protein [Bacillota bacterium]